MSDPAQELIAANKASRAKFLDLGKCGLKQVPAEVADLVWLESLSLAGAWWEPDGDRWAWRRSRNAGPENAIANLGQLGRLSRLHHLYLRGSEVVDLAPLASFFSLRTLDLNQTEIRDLSPLARLVGLRDLYLTDAPITDLGPLGDLSALRTLYLERTRVMNLGPLASLSSLKNLGLSRTPVADLEPLAALPDLRFLDVSGTRVTDLAPLIPLMRQGRQVESSWPNFRSGEGIYLGDCRLTSPPPEIVARGNEVILTYFDELARGGVDHLYEAKMLIVGEGGAGKTSLLRRLYLSDEPLPSESDSTKGIKIHKSEFKMKNGRTFRLNVWDFGGQQIYHATHQFFLTQRSLYVLLDDTRKDYKSVSDEGFKYWLELIDVFGGHSPTLIFQNEKSGRSKAIDFSGIKQRYDNVKELYAGNLEHRDSAEEVRDGIEFYATHLSHIGEEVPTRWLKVRDDIEELAAKEPHIPLQKYFEVYASHIETDKTKALLLSRYFHDLGVFLHFQDDILLKRTVILQNEWATEAVFRILDDEEVKRKRGRFNEKDCARLWKDSAYAAMHPELLALMKNFELCYELRDSFPSTWLAPQLLLPTKPEELGKWAKPEDLVLRYKYEFLPKGMISRLTVRLHRFVKEPEKAWVTGVFFEHDSTVALVEILSSGNEIELRARGPERKGLLSVIAADLDALIESFKGLRDKVDKLVPCNCKMCSAGSNPQFFSHKVLLRRREDRRMEVECGRSYEQVNVPELLDGIRMERPPVWASPRTERMFLASSSELRDDRDEFDSYFRRQNDRFMKQGIYLEIVRWEYFLDAISETRLQDEYNKAIRDCDIFVCLLFTKAGRFTEEEFDVAFKAFKDSGRPRVFTFFKEGSVNIRSLSAKDLQSLESFQKKLGDVGHFYTYYEDAKDLKLKFGEQFDKLMEQGRS